ncbi:MAG TPA: PadR family transcriptional regulator [Steroidobacteraceae bacterium]|nr:PadR family transcriptional regulator [Steroidobacteraceae bacterium]
MKAELIILGVLHRGDFHPYEIKRRVTNAMIECYTDVDVGTLYYAVRRLAKDGLIAAVTRERVARGGIRTVYGITAKGRQRFQELLTEQFEAEGSVADTMYGAMLFLHLADLPVVADLLLKKIARQNELIHKLDQIQKQIAPSLSTGGLHLMRHLSLQRRLDRQWLKALLADVVAGKVRDVPDPRKLAAPSQLVTLD